MDVTAAPVEETKPVGAYKRRREWDVGIDIGQASDPTAICAVETLTWDWLQGKYERPPALFHIRALQRLPLGMPYPDQCAELAKLLARAELAGAKVWIDATGVGRPVVDLFKRAGIKHKPIWITGGKEENEHEGGYTVPKLVLISRLQAALHAGDLKIAKALQDASAFTRELREFRVTWTEAGHVQFGARQGAHDDLVLAAALAIYGSERRRRNSSSVAPLSAFGLGYGAGRP